MDRLRRALLAVSVLLLAFSAVGAPAASFTDNDYDGIDDGVEQQLAEQFLPEIRYNWHEDCDWPTSRPVLFRLRHASVNGVMQPDYLVINYVRLYAEDCGVPAWPGHPGDNEAFMVFLRRINGNWTFSSVSTTNHGGTWYEEPTASFNPILWVSKNKHATYAELGACDGSGGVDYCSADGPTYTHTLHNVGEPTARLTNNLIDVYSGWWSESAWNDPNFLDAGNIESQLYINGFIQLTLPPEMHSCLEACQVEAKQCLAQNSFEYCQEQKSICEHTCYVTNAWWDP